MHQDPGERSSDPKGDCPGLACGYPGVSSRGVGPWWHAAGLGALNVAVHAWGLLKEVTIIFITSTTVWVQVNRREGIQLHPSIENWIKDLLSMALPIRTRPNFPHSQSLPPGSFHKPLIPPSEDRDRKPPSQKMNESNHMDHSLVYLNETTSHAM